MHWNTQSPFTSLLTSQFLLCLWLVMAANCLALVYIKHFTFHLQHWRWTLCYIVQGTRIFLQDTDIEKNCFSTTAKIWQEAGRGELHFTFSQVRVKIGIRQLFTTYVFYNLSLEVAFYWLNSNLKSTVRTVSILHKNYGNLFARKHNFFAHYPIKISRQFNHTEASMSKSLTYPFMA